MAWKNVQYENGKYRTSSGGGGGSSTFADLDDVNFSNLQNGQVAKYNSTTQKWENANESGGGGTTNLADLNDVTITNPLTGDVLKYDSELGDWVNVGNNLSDLNDVLINSIANGQILKWDNTAQKFKNGDMPIKTIGDSGNGFYSFKIGQSTTSSAVECLFGTFHSYNDITGFIFGRTMLCYLNYGCDAITAFSQRVNGNLAGSMPSRRYDTSTGKLYFTVPGWGQLWFFGWVNGVTVGS